MDAESACEGADRGRVSGMTLPVTDKTVDESAGSGTGLVQTRVSDAAQRAWAEVALTERLRVVRRARQRMAGMAAAFAAAIPEDLARTPADTMVAEVLPLLAAGRFLEREAAKILAVRRLGRRGLPFWLAGVDSEVRRVALGKVLVIGPANYPLLLPGVQTWQALVAGNAVVWKPGRGGRAVAALFAQAMYEAGLPHDLLRVAEESDAAGRTEIALGADKVFFTGSSTTGKALLRDLAGTATPSVMELSGCDAVVVLPTADLERVVQALVFGMRLNGSATCMAPRRVMLAGASAGRKRTLLRKLETELATVAGVRLAEVVRAQLRTLLDGARAMGAQVHGEMATEQQPILVTEVRPEMAIAQADVFAPLLMVMAVADEAGLLAAQEVCPYALTAAVFGEERTARGLAEKITAGTVVVNDVMVPTADPRVPFGGRRGSGFGVTRGAEGLLEMTAVKVIAVRRGKSTRHYDATGVAHEGLFAGLIAMSHAGTWRARWQGLKQVVAASKGLND